MREDPIGRASLRLTAELRCRCDPGMQLRVLRAEPLAEDGDLVLDARTRHGVENVQGGKCRESEDHNDDCARAIEKG